MCVCGSWSYCISIQKSVHIVGITDSPIKKQGDHRGIKHTYGHGLSYITKYSPSRDSSYTAEITLMIVSRQ